MSDPIVAKDYYAILGAEETASQDEIERLYKRLAKQHHPDRGGDPEEMKAINEAYRVLGNAATRRTYDSQFHRSDDVLLPVTTPPMSPPSSFIPDTVSGRFLGAFLFLLASLVFLFLVRIYYIRFMWPVLLAAVLFVIFSVWKLHAALVSARRRLPRTHPAHRFVWLQEIVFWSIACSGAYGLYILMMSI